MNASILRCRSSIPHWMFLVIAFQSSSVCYAEETSIPAIEGIIATAPVDGEPTRPFQFNCLAYETDTRHLPIGVFDSGIGGLTVLEAILALDAYDNDTLRPGSDGRRDFANERFIYLGDQANMPYGNYAAAGKEAYLRELILKDAVFLLGNRYWTTPRATQPSFDKPPVKAIVIACNTATAYGLEDLRRAMKAWNIPVVVVGVVEAGARGVAEVISANDGQRGVAVLATVGTCGSMAYPKAIGATVGLSGKRVPEVIQQGSVGLAGAIEGDPSFIVDNPEHDRGRRYQGPSDQNTTAFLNLKSLREYGFNQDGLLGSPDQPSSWKLNSIVNYARYDVVTLMEKHRASGSSIPVDTVVLGCTHFPLVQSEIREAFQRLREYREGNQQPYQSLIAESICLVNPAELTAKELFISLVRVRLRRDTQDNPASNGDQFYMSVPNPSWPEIRMTNDGGLDSEYKYGRNPGQLAVEDTRVVPITTKLLPASSMNLIRTRLPEVWSRIPQ